jgi:LssY C-terminus
MTKGMHRIDPHIDRERDRVESDLLFIGSATGYTDVNRPGAPRSTTNATGDDIATDGVMSCAIDLDIFDLGDGESGYRRGRQPVWSRTLYRESSGIPDGSANMRSNSSTSANWPAVKILPSVDRSIASQLARNTSKASKSGFISFTASSSISPELRGIVQSGRRYRPLVVRAPTLSLSLQPTIGSCIHSLYVRLSKQGPALRRAAWDFGRILREQFHGDAQHRFIPK